MELAEHRARWNIFLVVYRFEAVSVRVSVRITAVRAKSMSKSMSKPGPGPAGIAIIHPKGQTQTAVLVYRFRLGNSFLDDSGVRFLLVDLGEKYISSTVGLGSRIKLYKNTS